IVATDGEAVLAASNALEIGYTADDDASSVTADVTLATSGADGVTISWASDNETVISTGGTVTRPTGANVVVTLTATISKGIENATKVFTVRVLADGVVVTTNSGAARVFADAASVADVPLVSLTGTEPAGTAFVFNGGGAGDITRTVVSDNNGAFSSMNYLNVEEGGDGSGNGYAGFGWGFASYDMTAESNTAAKFLVRVAVGGPTSFGFVAQDGSGDTQSRVVKSFIADGTWQRVVVTVADFQSRTAEFDAANVSFIILSLDEALAASSTAINIDIDEVQFVITNIVATDGEAVLAASNALEIGYAPGDNVNSVTADVTLATSGADEVTISWASDNVAITTDGTVVRADMNTEVTLTATITKGLEEAMKVFTVTVLADSVVTTNSGAARVFADAASVADVPLAPAATPIAFQYAENGGDWSVAVTSNAGDGAGSSDEYLAIRESSGEAAGSYAGFGPSVEGYNMTAVTNTALKFYARSSVVSNFVIEVEGPAGGGNKSPRVNVNFNSDGTWQEVVIPMSSFTGGAANLTTLGNLVFIFIDGAIPNVTEAVSVDIDEVQFVITNIVATDGEAVSAASNALEIGYTAGDDASSVTADVTLATSGADEVTISWASDNVAIATDGTVVRPTGANVDVTLTATISKGIENATKVFTVTVLADGVVVATSGAGIIFADAAAVADVPLVGLTGTEPAGTAFGFSGGGVGDITRSLISDSDGAFSSTDYLDIQEGGDGIDTDPNTDFAGTGWGFTSFDMTAVANTAVKFLVRSPAGGATSFGFVAQDGSGNTQSRVVKSFIADGDWQTVIVTLAEFQAVTVEFDATDVRNIILSLDEAFVTVGDTPLTIDIDEVQFVITNIVATDGEAVLAASNALEIGYTAGDDASSVTANVTLLTSGADGVTISWASDNVAIATDGMVTRADTNTEVTLTATISKGLEEANKVFTVTVIQSPLTGGDAIIFADAASVADVGQINVSEMGTYNGGGAGALTLTVISSDGDDSLEHLNVEEGGDG
ncbi:MAG: hypothetical protein K0U41_02815, partial [Gammaproteobacteria bacterium]|nr:hypothetical protein [Gammaproteobacteria bacterium]